ncbi:MAG: hypothetical protein AABY38_06720 [Planctomycetota bacterium]
MINITTSFFLTLICIYTLTVSQAFAGNSISTDINCKLQKAKEFYNQRENSENLKLAIEEYKNILKQMPQGKEIYNKNCAEILIELSKCCFKLAEYHVKDNNEKALWFETGEKYGREAISLDSNNVGGYYWMVQNIGEHGCISKLYFLNKKNDFEEAIKKARLLDNHNKPYDYSGVYRTLAAYYTPRFMWGDLDKALEYAKKMEDSPRYLINLSVLADLYWKVDRERAKKYAKCVMNADLSKFPETQFENSIVQKDTAKKWRKLLE